MAKLIQPPQKFVTPEWYYGCRYLYGNTEAERAAAERLVMESQRTMEDTKKTTERLLFENKKRTGEPISFLLNNHDRYSSLHVYQQNNYRIEMQICACGD